MFRLTTVTVSLALVAGLAGTAAAQTSELNFDPYDGTTSQGTMETEASSYSVRLTPSSETMAASPKGLTPGFWKQEHHFLYWSGYTPSDDYYLIFGLTAPNNKPRTLLEALSLSDGGENALARHAVAALLNATSPYVDYAYSFSSIMLMVHNAYATGDFETPKDLLDAANNAGGEFPK